MDNNLTSEEQTYLKNFIEQVMVGETAQLKDLIQNCNISYQFAKTHSTYLKDWEKTKQKLEDDLKSNSLPPGITPSLQLAIINELEKIMQAKLQTVREAFKDKFGESIYNYLGPDGKTKKLFGIFG